MSPDGLSRPQAASGPSPRAVQRLSCAAGALCLLLEEPLPVACRESSAVTQTPRLHEARLCGALGASDTRSRISLPQMFPSS